MRSALIALFLTSLIGIASAQEGPESPLKDASVPPSASEREQIIEKTRELAERYTANLPNFVCTEIIRRSELDKRKQSWKPQDTLVLDLTYSKEGESQKLITINGKPTKKTLDDLDGLTFGGEFGSLLDSIFTAKSQTKFTWERWTSLRGRPAHVFSYRVELSHSEYNLAFSSLLKHYRGKFAFAGLVYVDRETNQVMRITDAPEGIPANWPVVAIPAELDYGFVDVGGKQFLLPLRAESRVIWRGGDQNLNVSEFSNYHKFSTETTITVEK